MCNNLVYKIHPYINTFFIGIYLKYSSVKDDCSFFYKI